VAAYLNSITAVRPGSPHQLHETRISSQLEQPSQHSQEAASECLTSSLMSQLNDIAQREAEAGDDSQREEELRQAVSRAVIESIVTGYTMANGDDMETCDRAPQNGGVDSTKRRRLDKPDD
jgi:uncharacterized protein